MNARTISQSNWIRISSDGSRAIYNFFLKCSAAGDSNAQWELRTTWQEYDGHETVHSYEQVKYCYITARLWVPKFLV